MLVYGERERVLEPGPTLDRLLGEADALAAAPEGLERHARLAEVLLDAGALVQGLADAEFERLGWDDDTPLQARAAAALVGLARPLIASWKVGFGGPLDIEAAPLRALAQARPPEGVRAKTPEGHAFYAVYPEAYAEAAAGFDAPATVIGLRSIGCVLGAVAAAALPGSRFFTVRPAGHPFRRELRLSPALQARLLERRDGLFVVVDEGPGLSGSSFGAACDWLQAHGVPLERIVLMPSHRGEPGPMASDAHRRRWDQARRPVREFDDLALGAADPGVRLERWVEDLTGPATAPLRDVSAGGWRALRRTAPVLWPPAYAAQERRKFLLTSAQGTWLVKFVGLGRKGREAFARAGRLGRAGFTPTPVGLRHGFQVEPWIEAAPLDRQVPRAGLVDFLIRYLAFRAREFPACAQDGANERELRAMVAANAQEALGADMARRLLQRLPRAGLPLRPVRTDGRMHVWEWLVLPDGRLLKTDAVDHDDAHDLIGCQDIAWDVAGAELELGLGEGEAARLLDGLARSGRPVEPEVLALMRIAYPSFQLGLWTHALAAADREDRARIGPLVDGYAERLEALALGWARSRNKGASAAVAPRIPPASEEERRP